MIFLGKTNTAHEVVHVSKASWTKGPMKATVRRQNVTDVIRPNDLVFLGHQIPNCGLGWGMREKIVAWAIKCAEKPSIIFDYDYRQVTNTKRVLPKHVSIQHPVKPCLRILSKMIYLDLGQTVRHSVISSMA